MMEQIRLKESETTDSDAFFDRIADDIKQVHIQFISEAGHGKSSSLKTILKHCKLKHPELSFKIFDLSLAWWHNAPVKHRQSVTAENLKANRVVNVDDCVYEIGSLNQETQRSFVASIIQQDYANRFDLEKANHGALKALPFITYVFEESDIYFGSYALRKNDWMTTVFKKFASVGRNLKMRGFLIATAEIGEISPGFRRRSRKIYGRVKSRADIAEVRREYKLLAKQLKSMPKYNFVYISDVPYGPVHIKDEVNSIPMDYFIAETETAYVYDRPWNLSWWQQFFIGTAIAMIIFWLSRRT